MPPLLVPAELDALAEEAAEELVLLSCTGPVSVLTSSSAGTSTSLSYCTSESLGLSDGGLSLTAALSTQLRVPLPHLRPFTHSDTLPGLHSAPLALQCSGGSPHFGAGAFSDVPSSSSPLLAISLQGLQCRPVTCLEEAHCTFHPCICRAGCTPTPS